MPLDYHTHTPRCRHAVGEAAEYAAQAVRRGLTEIGFSDHSPMPPTYDPHWRMTEGELAGYVEEVLALRGRFPGLTIRLGIEADYFPGTEGFVRDLLGRYEFDYVIGSVHYIDDWGFDNAENRERFEIGDLYEVYREYFERVRSLAETGLFDILGHADVIKKFGHRPERDFDPLLRGALEAVAGAGMALEVNTSGLRFPCAEIYPSRRMLEIARGFDIPVTLGSDAHRPEHVGQDFDRALDLLREAGYREILRFDRRQRESVRIS